MGFRQKLRYGHGIAIDADYPPCGSHDGISHIPSNCTHPMMKAMFISIEKHNAAAHMILELILEGSNENCCMLADVGSESRLGQLGALEPRSPD